MCVVTCLIAKMSSLTSRKVTVLSMFTTCNLRQKNSRSVFVSFFLFFLSLVVRVEVARVLCKLHSSWRERDRESLAMLTDYYDGRERGKTPKTRTGLMLHDGGSDAMGLVNRERGHSRDCLGLARWARRGRRSRRPGLT